MTNRDALKEFFGLEPEKGMCFGVLDKHYNCECPDGCPTPCKTCKYHDENWLDAEYKAPKKIVKKKVKYFLNLQELFKFVKEENILERDVEKIVHNDNLSAFPFTLIYNKVEYERVQTFEGRKKNDQ